MQRLTVSSGAGYAAHASSVGTLGGAAFDDGALDVNYCSSAVILLLPAAAASSGVISWLSRSTAGDRHHISADYGAQCPVAGPVVVSLDVYCVDLMSMLKVR